MQITINLETNANGELVIPVRKIDGTFTVRPMDVTNENHTRIYLYGATQLTNDCHASVKADPETMTDEELLSAHEAVTAAINKRWDAIYSGEWRVRTANGEPVNPVEREALSMAREAMRLAYAEKKKKEPKDENGKLRPKWGDIDEAKRDEAARAFFERDRDGYMAKAKARLDEKRASAKTVDLAALGL